jgi:hypothetical protein
MAKRGRPTKYRKEYCDQLIEHMGSGLSFETFAAVLNVSPQTIYQWTYDYQDFLEAKSLGVNACKIFWEKMGVHGAAGKLKNFNYGCWYRNMANRFPDKWRDKIEVTARDESLKDPSTMSDNELDERLGHALKVIDKYENKGSGTKGSQTVSGGKTKAITKKATARKSKK